ncbi:MAG: T9SS type A sorting domain-containing protein [Flexibacteraceae bacterium]
MRKIYTLCFLLATAFGMTANAQVIGENMMDNFENVRLFTYNLALTGGTFNGPIANPSATGANTSTQVGSYARNAGQQYDALVCDLPGNAVGINDYVTRTKKFSMKVWTNAPVGTPVQLTIQNKGQSRGDNYPAGRHSVYTTRTSVAGAWENLVFEFAEQPWNQAATVENRLDQVIVSFNNNSFTGDTYYFDELAGFGIATPPVIRPEFLWTNFSSVNPLTVPGADGVLTNVANPSRSPMHNSETVGQYVRSAVQYDVIRFAWGNSNLNGLPAYRNNEKKFFLKVYSPAVGTTVQFTLQSSTAFQLPYPQGRFSEFTGATTVANAWEWISLTHVGNPDGALAETAVREVAILFNSNTTAPITVHMDSICGPGGAAGFVPLSAKTINTSIKANVYPNPTTTKLNVQMPETGVYINEVVIRNLAGQVLTTQNFAANQLSNATVSVATLTNGLYLCEVKTNKGVTTKRFTVSK